MEAVAVANETEAKKELTTWETFRILFTTSRGFLLINMVNFADGIAYFGILTLLTVFLGDRVGMSDKLGGISVSTFTGLVTLFMFGGGFVCDKLGVRRALTWSLLIIGAGRALLTLAPGVGPQPTPYLTAWLGLLFMALGSGILQPALYAGIKDYTDSRTATVGYSLIYSIMNLGIVAENFISPYIRVQNVFLDLNFKQIVGLGWGIDGVYWFCVSITGLVLLLHMTFFTKAIEQRESQAAKAPVEIKPKRPLMERLKELPFLDARFMFFIFVLLPVQTLFAHQFLTIPAYIFRAFPSAVGDKYEWISGLNPLIIVVFVPFFAILTKNVHVVYMMIIGTLVSAATSFILVPGPALSTLLIYAVLFSFGEALWSSRFYEHVANLAPAGKVGAYMGLAGLPWFMAKFTTGLYSGWMLERFIPKTGTQDSGMLWLIYGCIASTSPVMLVLARRWLMVEKKAS